MVKNINGFINTRNRGSIQGSSMLLFTGIRHTSSLKKTVLYQLKKKKYNEQYRKFNMFSIFTNEKLG